MPTPCSPPASPTHAHLDDASPTVTSRLCLALSVAVLLLASLAACGDNPVASDEEPEDETEVTENVDVELPVDEGEVGLVLDVRAMFRKGYVATEADVRFPEHARFDTTMEIDPVSNLAVLYIPNKSLTDEEKEAVASGIAADITIYGEGQTVLAEHQEAELVLDDSNTPLSLDTDQPYIKRPLKLKEDIPYLLQPENGDGVITSQCIDCYIFDSYTPEAPTQQFYFTPVADSPDPDTYVIQHFGYDTRTYLYVGESGYLTLIDGSVDVPQEFVLEQDDDGWIELRIASTDEYVVQQGLELRVSSDEFDRFRLISDNIDWSVTDRGTVYHEPVTPPAQLDFAYEATIRNCSVATLTETIGRAESRTRSSTTATSESLQLFSSEELGVGLKVGVEVGQGTQVTGSVKGSVEASTNYTYTTSQTTSTENTFSETTQETSEVSRTRQLEVPPFSAVEVYDAVRTIENVRVPFTQVLRISATYDEDGSALTGSEIVTQMLFNFIEGVPSAIGGTYVDVSLRGHVLIDQLFEAETDANDLPGACD